MYWGKMPFGVRGTSKCQPVPWVVRARGCPPPVAFGSGWAAVCPARGVTDSWQLPAQGDLPVPSSELSLLLVQCVTEPVQLAKQAKPILTAVVLLCSVGSGRPQQALLLLQRRGKEKRMEPLLLWEWAVTLQVC